MASGGCRSTRGVLSVFRVLFRPLLLIGRVEISPIDGDATGPSLVHALPIQRTPKLCFYILALSLKVIKRKFRKTV
jgi:hypothetical protein